MQKQIKAVMGLFRFLVDTMHAPCVCMFLQTLFKIKRKYRLCTQFVRHNHAKSFDGKLRCQTGNQMINKSQNSISTMAVVRRLH